jgi:uncharacterized protein (TIGR00369 family)
VERKPQRRPSSRRTEPPEGQTMTGTAQFDQAEAVAEPGTALDAARERTYRWTDPLAIVGAGAGLSGLEFFTAMAEGRIPTPPIMHTVDFNGMAFEEGRVSFRLTPREFHYNPLGSVHGGVFATLLDTACGCAVHTKLPAGLFYTSLDLAVKFLRPVTVATGEVIAEGSVVHYGRRTALAEARIVDTAGKIYATATSSCLIMRPEG